MSTQQTHYIDNYRKLIELNGNLTNFECSFNVTSSGNTPFSALVADQNSLDTNPNMPYKQATDGQISGTITQDKNVYQPYYLVLKTDTPGEVTINLNVKEIPPNNQNVNNSPPNPQQGPTFSKEAYQQQKPYTPPQQKPYTSPHPQQQHPQQQHPQHPPVKQEVEKSKTNWKFIFTIFLVVGGCALLYYFYTKNKDKFFTNKSSIIQQPVLQNVVVPQIPVPTPPAPVLAPVLAPVMLPTPSVKSSSVLMDKLNSLQYSTN